MDLEGAREFCGQLRRLGVTEYRTRTRLEAERCPREIIQVVMAEYAEARKEDKARQKRFVRRVAWTVFAVSFSLFVYLMYFIDGRMILSRGLLAIATLSLLTALFADLRGVA